MLEIQAIQKSASTTNGHVVSDPVFCMIPASKDLDTLAGLYKKELKLLLSKAQKPYTFLLSPAAPSRFYSGPSARSTVPSLISEMQAILP